MSGCYLCKIIYTKLFGSAQSLHSVSPFQGYTPADCFMLRARSLTFDSALPKIWLRFIIFYKIISLRSVFAPVEFSSKTLTSPINYFALYSEAGSLPRLKLRTAYAFFLTIRQADFPLKRTLPCTAQPFRLRLQEELLNGLCPGANRPRAGLCKAHKARLCELERNPRQPTTNPQSVI